MLAEDLQRRLLDALVPAHAGEAIALSDYMAKNPELGSCEFQSSRHIVELLKKHGIETEYPFCDIQTAFIARINPDEKKRAALLCEYDALPDIGHACGHCASGSASVLAALALNDARDELGFGVDVIGTPDEEMMGGKAVMANRGVFDAYEFAMMVHMGPESGVETNFIALDGTTIKFFGQPAHAAAAPEQGRNALNAARLFFDMTDMMRQHIVQEARLHGYIKNGGVASNIVPDYAEVEFLSRAPKRRELTPITEWVYDCVKAAALATHTEYEICKFGEPFHDLYISEAGKALMNECFSELGLDVGGISLSAGGSSDMGNVDYVCPAFHPVMGIGRPYMAHTREFGEAMTEPGTHAAIVNAAKLMLLMVCKLFGDGELLKEVKRQHREYRNA